MIRNILVPQDGSNHSRTALDYAIWLARRMQAKLVGIYVVNIVALEGPFLHDLSGSLGFEPYLNFSTKMREVLEAKGEEILKTFQEKCGVDGIENEVYASTGIVVNEICEKAKVADLIIMGRQGINVQFEYGLLGSTTEGVLRKASKPVLTVPDTFKEPANPLLAYDGSVTASKAMHSAAEFVKALGLPLTVLSVSRDDSGEKLLDDAEDYLKPYKIQPKFINKKGDTHKGIVDYYKDNNHDILFIGASHHSRIVKMVLGSTTEYVMRSINAPIFLER